MDIVAVPYKNGKILLKIPEIKDLQNIDVEKVTKIQYDKISAEIITFPVILNRLGLILAEADNAVSIAELDLKIGKAKLAKEAAQDLSDSGDKVTENNINNWIRVQARYRELNETHIEAKRKRDIVNSAYWSAQDKSKKLDKLSSELRSDDFTIDNLVEEINGIKIIVKKNVIG